MSGKKANACWVSFVLVFFVLFSSFPCSITALSIENSGAVELMVDAINQQILNFSVVFKDDIQKNFGYCVTEV